MRAAKVDANQPEIVRAFRDLGATVTHLHAVGHGCPDLLIGYKGRFGVAEVKDGTKPPSARKLTAAQIAWWDEHEAIHPKAIVETVEDVARFLARFPV